MIHFVEKTWGIHYVMGGTGALVQAYVKKFQELGGVIEYNAEVAEIMVEKTGFMSKPVAKGVKLKNGRTRIGCGVFKRRLCHNLYENDSFQVQNVESRLEDQTDEISMSLVVIYFGFKKSEAELKGEELDLRHHNIILSEHYAELLTDISIERCSRVSSVSIFIFQLLTDPSMAQRVITRRTL